MPDVDPHTAARALAESLLTEPMTVSRLAEYFGVGRNKMRRILDAMPGTERHGRLCRVPVAKMPPAYLIERGLLPAAADRNCA